MKKKILVLSLISLLLLAGCKNKVELKDGKQVVASVKGKKITAEELFDDLKKNYGASSVIKEIDTFIIKKEISDSDSKQAKEYAKSQVSVMKQQYEQAGYKWEDALSQYGYSSEKELVEEYQLSKEKEMVAKKYIKKNITDEEIKAYYDKEIYGTYTVKHILITPDVEDKASDEEKEKANEKAKKTAKEVIKKLDEGAKWKDLVKKYSDDKGSKDKEGLIENFTKGDVVDEFFEATLKLKDGKYTKEPVESTYGYHIILKVSNTKKPSLKDSTSKIKEEIATNKMNNDDTLLNKTWIDIRKSYDLKISDSDVQSGYNKMKSNN